MTSDETALTIIRDKFAEPEGWNWCSDYGEPGYSHDGDQQVVVLGDYWCRCKNNPHAGREKYRYRRDDPVTYIEPGDTHDYAAHHPRLWARLEEVASFEWRDEWLTDNDKCYRTTGDCYGWTPSAVYTEHGDVLSHEDDIENIIEYGLGDDHRRALYPTLVDITALEAAGFVRWPDDDTFYESGWHPGQTDDPTEKVKLIRAERGDDEQILIYVTGVGQFDTRWVVLTRPDPEGDDE